MKSSTKGDNNILKRHKHTVKGAGQHSHRAAFTHQRLLISEKKSIKLSLHYYINITPLTMIIDYNKVYICQERLIHKLLFPEKFGVVGGQF